MTWLVVGLLAGYWANLMYAKVSKLLAYFKDRLDSPPGVVKPQAQLIGQVNTNATGGVLRPSPNQVALEAMIERDRKIKDMSI